MKSQFLNLENMRKNVTSITLLSVLLATSCKKPVIPPPPETEDLKLLTFESLVNENADWEHIVTTSAEDPQNGYQYEGHFAGMFNKNFKIKIQGRSSPSDQYSTSYYLKFNQDGSNKFVYEKESTTQPYYYKNPNNENEYYEAGFGSLTGNNAGKNILDYKYYVNWVTYNQGDLDGGAVVKRTVNPQATTLIKNTFSESYKSTWDPNYLMTMNNIDFTPDFALCGTYISDQNGLFYSPAGLTSTTYFHMPPQSDYADKDWSIGGGGVMGRTGYHAGIGFFNSDNEPRFLGIHYAWRDEGLPSEIEGNVTAKCYYPVNVNHTGWRASHFSGPQSIKSMMLEKSEILISDLYTDGDISRIKKKILKVGDEILVLLDFYEGKKLLYFKYNHKEKKFTTVLPLQSYPENFNIETTVLAPDGNIYYYNTDAVYVIKNGITKMIHSRSMFKDTNDPLTEYRGIAMKGDKLLLFVVRNVIVNNMFDFRISTIIAKTTF